MWKPENILSQIRVLFKVTGRVPMNSRIILPKHSKTTIMITNMTASQYLPEHSCSQYITSNHISISQEYAGDISEITSNPDRIKHLKENLPIKLAERNLIINESKTEEYIISRSNQDTSWKSCKLLYSLHTENYIRRRKG